MDFVVKEINNEKLRFELIYNSAIEDLKCCICLELVDKPQIASECNHFFCKTCIEHYFGDVIPVKTCPLCKVMIRSSNLKHFFLAETLISKLNVKCSQKNCQDVIIINNIENHINNCCESYERKCKFNCGNKFLKKDIKQHEMNCFNNPEVEINCEKCHEKIFAVNLKMHLEEDCEEELDRCWYGCKEFIIRKNIEEHNKKFAEIHAENMRNMVIKYQDKYKILKKRHDEMCGNINKFKTYFNTINPQSFESFNLFEKRHTGFGNYDFFMNAHSYIYIAAQIKNHIENFEK